LNTKFTTALDNAAVDAQKAGNLPAVLAIEEDKKRIGGKLPLPDSDDEQTPESLKKLRGIYREQWKKLEDQRAASYNAILPGYTAKLQEMEVTLTKAARVDEAKEIMAYRQGLALGAAAPAPAAATPTGGKPNAERTTAAKTNYPKGDDRKAAEWLVSIGADFTLSDRGKFVRPTDPADLPKGKFTITKAVMDDRFTKAPVTADGLRLLTGLEDLTWLEMGAKDVGPEGFAFLASLPNLETLSVGGYQTITDGVIDHLVGARKLTSLVVNGSGVTGATLDRLAGLTNLRGFGAYASKFNNAGVAAIAQVKSIKRMSLEATAITDEAVAFLSGMPQLEDLDVSGTRVTPEGLITLKNARNIRSLHFGIIAGKTMRDTATIIAPVFSNVESTRAAGAHHYTAEDLAALGHFKNLKSATILVVSDAAAWSGLNAVPQLTSLVVDRKPFADDALAHLISHPGIVSLVIAESDVTDAGLMQLVKMKKLKSLTIRKSPVTDAGITAFKKKHPDVNVDK